MKPRQSAQHGYVLLMTVLLLAVAAVALASVGRSSARQAVLALKAEQNLQRRWAVRSCARFLLPKTESALDHAQGGRSRLETTVGFIGGGKPPRQPAAAVERRIQLGDLDITLTFADEQAKLNVNAVFKRRGKDAAGEAVRTLTRSAAANVRLRPLTIDHRKLNDLPSQWPAFASYDQVFADIAPPALSDVDITCWGDGQVNFHRAPAQVLMVALMPDLTSNQAARLAALREENPSISLDEALDDLQLSERQRRGVLRKLTDTSDCHSLWVVVRDGQRRWRHLFVDGGRNPRPWHFVW